MIANKGPRDPTSYISIISYAWWEHFHFHFHFTDEIFGDNFCTDT